MHVIRARYQVNRHGVDRGETGRDHRRLLFFLAIEWIIGLVAVLDSDLVIPFTRLKWLRLHRPEVFRGLAPLFAHVSTNIFDVAMPVRASNHIDAKFAHFAVAIHILVIACFVQVNAGGEGDKFVHVLTIVRVFTLGQTVEHLSRSH